MNNPKKFSRAAILGIAVLAAGGCADIQTARLAAPPDLLRVATRAGVADATAARTVRDSRLLVTQAAVAAKSDSRIVALQPAVAGVVRDAVNTHAATMATVAAIKPAMQQQAVFIKSARAVQAGELHNAARYHAITHSLSYKLGRFIVVTVFLLLVFGGLIIFSESGWAGVLGVKWPILASVLFKPLEYLGTLLGALWGFVESGVARLWRAVVQYLIAPASPAS
jgi:hypothetical protein